MHRIKSTQLNLIWRLLLALAIALPASLTAGVSDVQAGGIPFFGLIPAVIKRNRVYTTANAFIKDKAQYYDALRDTAAQQLLDRELTFGLRDNQVAAYIKVVALLEQERDSMYDFAESEKKAARDEFIDVLQDELTNAMLATTPATRVLGAMTEGINSSQGFVESIISKLTGNAGGAFADLAKIRRIGDRMTIVGQIFGGNVGKSIQKAGTKISRLASPTDSIESDLIKIQGELGALAGLVRGLQDRGYKPTASQTTREVAIHLVTGESTNPAIEAIADMLVAKHGGDGNLRDRARDIMLGNASARCRAKVEQIRRVVFRLETEPAAEDTSDIGDFPACETVDIAGMVEEIEQLGEAEESPSEDPDQVTSGDDPESVQPDQSDPSQPPDPGSAESGSTSSSSEYVWVLTNTEVNVDNAKSAFFGGGQDLTWFGEARFEGKSLVFGYSANNFSVNDVEVDHGYEYHDVTVSVDFDSPPARLEPGQQINLNASASQSGTVNEGGNGIGLIFQYSQNKVALDPLLYYSPWDPNFNGVSTGSWDFTAPSASEGGEFQFSAGLWNSPP